MHKQNGARRVFLLITSFLLVISAVIVPINAVGAYVLPGELKTILNKGIDRLDPELCVTSSGGAGSCAALAEIRQEMTAGLSDSDKVLIYKSYLTETGVNPDSEAGKAKAQAHIEEVLNRAAARFRSDIQKELYYIQNAPPGYYQDFCSTSASWKNCDARVTQYRTELDAIWEKVIKGSNIVHGATDNASAGVAYGSRASVICGMSSEDTECKTDDYNVQTKFAGGQSDVISGVEYFFDNNSSDTFREIAAGCNEPSSSGSSSTSTSNSAYVDDSAVTWIGDSLSVGAQTQVALKLPDADLYAQTGKQFGTSSDTASPQDPKVNSANSGTPTGISILKQLVEDGSIRDYVVFALGTNGATSVNADTIAAVRSIIGENRKLVLVTNYDSLDGNRYTANNNAMADAANAHPNTYLADWAKEASDNNATMNDGIHPSDDATKQLFVSTIYKALSSGSDEDECITDTSITVDGYTFPIKGATQENVNQISGLTKLPCGPDIGTSCHGGRGAEGGAVDLGLGPTNAEGNIIVAPHDGVIMYTSTRNGYSYCNDISFQATENGEPVAIFGMLHLGEISVTMGQEVKVGEEIGVIGALECADNTIEHIHFDKSISATTNTTGDYDNGRDPSLATLINKLYELLPKE